ncbi:hypothetical protein LCGC14_0930030 [marine sediment metagenome]|uniref:Uncharacterized protein n=1 Tax=marine sediment metagenome TaxID=412755 RepID=A0A0F9RUV2_9ZZZZ
MKLDVPDRLILRQTLNNFTGDIITLDIMDAFLKDLGFSEAEVLEFDLVTKDGKATWEHNGTKEVEVGKILHGLVRGVFVQLNDRRKMNFDQMPLYKRFMETPRERADREEGEGKKRPLEAVD